MNVIIRGDCSCHRALNFNRDLFGGPPIRVVSDQKTRTDFLVDHFTIGSATVTDLRQWQDLASMPKGARNYSLNQLGRDTLSVSDARLILMDNYADMNFSAWKHRQKGWKIWINKRFLLNEEAFMETFERCGHLTVEESIEGQVMLIEHYRRMNGDIPVLYFNQPILFYPKLKYRDEFRQVGFALEERVSNLFLGEIDESEIEGDGVQPLHFTPQTYRKMIQAAMKKGLLESWSSGQTVS